jgi:CHAT domain
MADTIMVAYSFNQDKPLQVTAELKAITELVQKTRCKIDPLTNVNQKQLEDRITKVGKDILIFHFAGHAGGASIELNDEFSEKVSLTNMQFFSQIIAQDARAMRLVFLNGCSTEDQSAYLRAQGVPVVISTTLPLDDNYAFAFAKLFYDKFFNSESGLSLQKAFDNTLLSFKSKDNTQFFDANGNIKNDVLLHPAKRGNFAVTLETPSEIYRIDGDPAVLGQTFAEWQVETIAPAGPVTDLDKTKPVSGGLFQDDCYLLCDREPQVRALRNILRSKVQGQNPEPSFIFVNGQNADGIPDLLQRFEKYVVPEVSSGFTPRIDGLKFPDADFFDLPNDEKKPLLHLQEIYREQLLNTTGQKFGDDTLFLICHKIYKPFWKNGIENLFRFYLKDYSATMRQQIGERIVVLFFLVHNDRPEQKETLENFGKLYAALKKDFPERVEYFDKLPLIEEGDLFEWHDEMFDSALDTNEFPLESPTMYFTAARKYMEKVIAERKRNA